MLLAFFVPAVVYMADAVGTQTETVLIRGLAVGVTVRGPQARLATGLLVGLLIAAVFFPRADRMGRCGRRARRLARPGRELRDRDGGRDGPAVGAQPPRRDPAFGSGPVATIIQDLLSIAVYLAIATTIAT